MVGKRNLVKLAAIGLVAVLALAAVGFVAAQQHETPGNHPPLLGITFAPGDNGAVVTGVLPGSPADAAGLEIGDVITQLNGKDITADSIGDTVGSLNAGDKLDLAVKRGDETLDLSATLAERSGNEAHEFMFPNMGERPYLGVRLEDTDKGVTIREIEQGSPASDAGLQVDDILKTVNGTDVKTAQEVVNIIRDLKIGDKVTLGIERSGEAQSLDTTLAAAPMMQAFGNFGGNNEIGIQWNADDQTWEITKLTDKSPLYEAGLREGDAITKINGEIYTPENLMSFLNGLQLDETTTVTLTVTRGTDTLTIDVPAKDMTAFAMMPFNFEFRNGEMPFDFAPMMGGVRLGVEFVQLDEQNAKEHNVTETSGALITQVLENSPAAEAGLKVGDIVKTVDGDVLDTERTLRDRLLAYEPGDKVTLSVLRDGATQDIEVTLGSGEMSSDMFGGMPFDFNHMPFGVPSDQSQPDMSSGNNL